MTEERTGEIRRRLDNSLSLDAFERDARSTDEAATGFFQDLFVDVLDFETTPSPLGDATWQALPVNDWPDGDRTTAVRLFGESGNVRLLYVELESLTRTAERNAIQSLARSDGTGEWAIDGSFLTVFHAPDEDVWHLVTPYEEETDDITTGRPVLRRYTLGEGETHRTVAAALANLNASQGRLAERVDEAFGVNPVTEAFYEDYKSAFDTLSHELRGNGLAIETAERYAHVTLNRLLFLYYLQKKGWIGDRKDFVSWFHEQYIASPDEDAFHETWLSTLFFDAMNAPRGTPVGEALPESVATALAELPYLNGGLFQRTDADETDVFLSDDALASVIDGFLEAYNFTVTEESPYDIDVAVDPAMLGKIYESLIAEQERGEAGIFYTPRVEVDLMCRMALYEQLRARADELAVDGDAQLVEFVFSEPRDWDASAVGNADALEGILHDLRIVDPACGSGAFLVGMKQVLTELYRKLGVDPDYHRTARILNENIYGVDIKDWAVRVAEFRLWLSLVEGEELPDKEPVLPNFSFTLRTGDSIVQTIDGERVSLRALGRNAGEDTRGVLAELQSRKEASLESGAGERGDGREKQVDALRTYIDDRIEALREGSTQQASPPMDAGQTVDGDGQTVDGDGPTVDARVAELESLRETVTNASDEFFLWDLDFSAVMVDGGFDVVVGNPPYVRGREIVPQSYTRDQLEAMSRGDRSDLGAAYKTNLREYAVETFDVKPYKTSDLYLYFFFKAFDVLAPAGTLAFVTSNSWLNTKYGKRLQEGLLKFTEPQYVLDNRSTRTFAEADINTAITVANRSASPELAGECEFTSVHRPYSEFVDGETLQELLAADGADYEIEYRDETFEVTGRDSFRSVSIPSETLWSLGGGTVGSTLADGRGKAPQGTYDGDRWVLYHRAPDIYFRMLNHAGDAFDELGEHVADVKTGAYSGLNDFYYFETERGAGFEERIDDRFLLPFIRSPDQVQTPLFDPSTLETSVFVCRLSKAELRREGYDAALEYIEWGEGQTRDDGTPWPDVSSVEGREPGWWALPAKDSRPTNCFVGYVVDRRFRAAFTDDLVTSDRCFHRVYDDTDRLRRLHVLFCSSLGPFLIELTGTSNLGQGALKFETRLLEGLPIPDPDDVDYDAVAEPMAALGERPIGSVFEELGAETLEAVTLDGVRDDRRAIDQYVLGEILGLAESEQLDVYRQLIEMVGNRIGKANLT